MRRSGCRRPCRNCVQKHCNYGVICNSEIEIVYDILPVYASTYGGCCISGIDWCPMAAGTSTGHSLYNFFLLGTCM
jgi:hypothetical protein